MKPHKRFEAAFYRPLTEAERALYRADKSVAVLERTEAPSEKQAEGWAKALAEQRGWQLIGVREVTICSKCGYEIIWFEPAHPGTRCPGCGTWNTVSANPLARQIVANLGFRWLLARQTHRRAQQALAENDPDAFGCDNLVGLEMSTNAQEAEAWNAFQSAMSILYGRGG